MFLLSYQTIYLKIDIVVLDLVITFIILELIIIMNLYLSTLVANLLEIIENLKDTSMGLYS